MLLLFRFFLAFSLGVDAPVAERLTDLDAWRNPLSQVGLLAGWEFPAAGLRDSPTGPSWEGEVAHGGPGPAGGGAHVSRAHRDSRPRSQ